MAKSKSTTAELPIGRDNQTSYELCLAQSLITTIAQELAADERRQNVLYSALDHMSRAKNLIDEVSHG